MLKITATKRYQEKLREKERQTEIGREGERMKESIDFCSIEITSDCYNFPLKHP